MFHFLGCWVHTWLKQFRVCVNILPNMTNWGPLGNFSMQKLRQARTYWCCWPRKHVYCALAPPVSKSGCRYLPEGGRVLQSPQTTRCLSGETTLLRRHLDGMGAKVAKVLKYFIDLLGFRCMLEHQVLYFTVFWQQQYEGQDPTFTLVIHCGCKN